MGIYLLLMRQDLFGSPRKSTKRANGFLANKPSLQQRADAVSKVTDPPWNYKRTLRSWKSRKIMENNKLVTD